MVIIYFRYAVSMFLAAMKITDAGSPVLGLSGSRVSSSFRPLSSNKRCQDSRVLKNQGEGSVKRWLKPRQLPCRHPSR